MEKIKPGIYRHYKGKEYNVYGEVILSGTEDLSSPVFAVIYRPRYGQRRLTSRPKIEFLENVSIEGVLTPRFVFVRELENPELKIITAFFSS